LIARVGTQETESVVRPGLGTVLKVPKGESFTIRIAVKPGVRWQSCGGFDVAWVRVYFITAEGNDVYEVGNFELAGGKGPAGTGQDVVFGMSISEPGEMVVLTYSLAEGLVANSRFFEIIS